MTTDCAIRMLLCLAVEKHLIVSEELAHKVGVKRKYLIDVGKVLRDAEIVSVSPGPYGGYSLAKPAESILIQDILEVFDDTVQCSYLNSLTGTAATTAECFYDEIEQCTEALCKSHTLADLVKGKINKRVVQTQKYS